MLPTQPFNLAFVRPRIRNPEKQSYSEEPRSCVFLDARTQFTERDKKNDFWYTQGGFTLRKQSVIAENGKTLKNFQCR